MKNILLFSYAAMMLTIAACKKSKDEKAPCRMSSITPSGLGNVTNLYYDEQNRLKSIRQGANNITLEYKADSLIALEKRNGSFYQKKKCKLNAQGFPSAVLLEVDPSGYPWLKFAYEYNGTEMIKETETTPANISSVVSFTWNNGNLTSRTSAWDKYEYEYYTDQPYQQADAYVIEMMIPGIGVEILRNKNLLKKIKYNRPGVGSYTYSYEYRFDKDGKVAKIIRSDEGSNEKLEWDIQHQCNN